MVDPSSGYSRPQDDGHIQCYAKKNHHTHNHAFYPKLRLSSRGWFQIR